MSNTARKVHPPSLAAITAIFVMLSASVGLAAAYIVINDRARSFEQASLQRALEMRTRGLQTALAQALAREWETLIALGEQASVRDPHDFQLGLSAIVGKGSVVSWAGYAEPDGTVVSASNGLLVGESVAERPWFREGLRGPFAGNAHDAVLLASRLPETPEPRRFLDFAIPVTTAEGGVRGVLGIHIDVTWVQRLINQLTDAMQLDLIIVGPDGGVVASSLSNPPDLTALGSLQRARTGVFGSSLEEWPDGKEYFSLTVQELEYPSLPRFGWNLVARIDGDAATVPAREMSDYLILRLAGFAVILLLLTGLYIVAFIRPFSRLALNAFEIADGHDTYPMESNRTRELSTISGALARLQAELRRSDGSSESAGARK